MTYTNGKIYKIANKNNPDEFYIGSTTNHLRIRWKGHKDKMKEKPDRLLYQRMHELGIECFHIVLMEDYPCDTKDQLRQREDYWICKMKPNLNKLRAYLTDDEKRENNKLNCREWYSNHKDKVREYYKQYRVENKARLYEQIECDNCYSIVARQNMDRHRQTKKCRSHQSERTEYTEIEFID